MAVFTGLDNFPATDQGDVGGQHPRAAPAFMSGTHRESDGRRRPPGRHDDRPDHRRRDLPRHEASVIGNDGRSHRRRRRLRPRLRLRVHELYVVENPDDTAAVRDEPSVHFRADVRRREHGGGAAAPCRGRSQHPRRHHGGNRRASPQARLARSHQAGRVLRCRSRCRAADCEGRVDQQRLLRAGSACRRARHVQGIYRAAVRPPGAGVPGRHHACRHPHDGAREHRARVSGDRHCRCASLHLAPRQQPRQARGVCEDQLVPRRDAELLPQEARIDSRRGCARSSIAPRCSLAAA